MLAVSMQLVGVEEAAARLKTSIDDGMQTVFRDAGLMIAGSAKSQHRFQNQTGDLERSIKSNPPRGTFSNNTLSVTVSATTYYAKFVEEMFTYQSWAYLRPAWDRTKSLIKRGLGDALTRAAQRAKW